MFPAELFRQIQSSPHSIWQPIMRTFVLWSGSIPSEFATFKSFKMRMRSINTSSQPAVCKVQKETFLIIIFVKLI